MKKVKVFKTMDEARHFLNLLKDEFKLTRFDIIENLVLYPTFYTYKVDLNFEEEGSAGQVSKFFLKLSGGADWGTPSSTGETTYHLDFNWTTSSKHKFQVKGYYGSEGTHLEVFIGEDESSYFYPTILNLLSKI